MGKAQAMSKNYPGAAPHPVLLLFAASSAGIALYLPTGYVYESVATATYTLYWCLSMVHNIKTGPPVSHTRARMVYWALTLSVPSLGLAFWLALTGLLLCVWLFSGWPPGATVKGSYLVGLPFATASTMLYLGRVLEDMAHDDEPTIASSDGDT